MCIPVFLRKEMHGSEVQYQQFFLVSHDLSGVIQSLNIYKLNAFWKYISLVHWQVQMPLAFSYEITIVVSNMQDLNLHNALLKTCFTLNLAA